MKGVFQSVPTLEPLNTHKELHDVSKEMTSKCNFQSLCATLGDSKIEPKVRPAAVPEGAVTPVFDDDSSSDNRKSIQEEAVPIANTLYYQAKNKATLTEQEVNPRSATQLEVSKKRQLAQEKAIVKYNRKTSNQS